MSAKSDRQGACDKSASDPLSYCTTTTTTTTKRLDRAIVMIDYNHHPF